MHAVNWERSGLKTVYMYILFVYSHMHIQAHGSYQIKIAHAHRKTYVRGLSIVSHNGASLVPSFFFVCGKRGWA